MFIPKLNLFSLLGPVGLSALLMFIVACGGSGGVKEGPEEEVNYALTVSVSGEGEVTSSPSGISCGSDCSNDFSEGTSVTLVAAADTGWIFDSWNG